MSGATVWELRGYFSQLAEARHPAASSTLREKLLVHLSSAHVLQHSGIALSLLLQHWESIPASSELALLLCRSLRRSMHLGKVWQVAASSGVLTGLCELATREPLAPVLLTEACLTMVGVISPGHALHHDQLSPGLGGLLSAIRSLCGDGQCAEAASQLLHTLVCCKDHGQLYKHTLVSHGVISVISLCQPQLDGPHADRASATVCALLERLDLVPEVLDQGAVELICLLSAPHQGRKNNEVGHR